MMSKRFLLPLMAFSMMMLVAIGSRAQETKAKDPDSKHALDLRVRKAGEDEFTKDTKKYGVEVYTDGNSADGIHISEAGAVSVVPSKLFKAGDGKSKSPLHLHGLGLKARPAGEKDFDKAKKYGMEVFKDENNGNLVYISEAGLVATVPSKYVVPSPVEKGKPKNPKWIHAMELKVRKAGEKDFSKDTKKVALEVFLDENTDTTLYVTEGGAVAVVGSKLGGKSDKDKGPKWQHGMELDARKAGEKEFTKDTKKYGVEAFLDENTGNLIYVCETGAIAVVPGKFAKATEGKAKGPDWKSAMELQVRKAGEKEFAKDTKKYGVEVYLDENNGNLIYISETGDLSVVSPKSE